MSEPTSFHLFPQLPPELRNQIYTLALPEPILHEITPASSHSPPSSSSASPAKSLRFTNPRALSPPSLSAVSREARSLTLHTYKPLTLNGTTKYIDPSRDMLLLEASLTGRELLRVLSMLGKIPVVRDGLRGLALGTSWGVHTGIWHTVLGWGRHRKGGSGGNSVGKLVARLAAFKRLERLVFLVRQEVQVEIATGSPAWGEQQGAVTCHTMLHLDTTPSIWSSRLSTESESELQGDDDGSSRASSPRSCSVYSCSSSCSESEGGDNTIPTNFYRLSWTVEKPCTPHENELSYYPSPSTGETDDDKGQDVDQVHPQPLRGSMPTQEDWLRFQKLFKRQLEAGLAQGRTGNRTMTTMAADIGNRMPVSGGACGGRKRKREQVIQDGEIVLHTECKRLRRGLTQEGVVSKLPTIEGANALWRYSLPVGVGGH